MEWFRLSWTPDVASQGGSFLRTEIPVQRRRRRKRPTIIVAVVAIVFLFLLALLIDSTLYIGKVHAGVTVSGVRLGGLTPQEAKAALELRAEEAQKNRITLTSGDKKWTVAPTDVGTKVDAVATVGEAMAASRKGNFLADRFRGFRLYFKDEQIPLQGTVDSAKMNLLLADVAQVVDIPPVNAGLVFDGSKIRVVKGQKGRVVDRGACASQLTALLLTLHGAELAVPMAVKDPAVQADDYDRALQQAMTMTGSPVTLTNGSHSWALTPEQIIAYMDFASKTQDGVSILVPYLSAAKMGPFLDDLATAVKRDPVSASFKGDGQKAWVVAAVAGSELDRDKTVERLNAAALDTNHRDIQAAMTIVEPDLTTAEAEAMGIKVKLADFQTEWEGTPDRQTNVRITTQYASNVILAPGEIYDFDKQIGPRAEQRGYKLAPGIVAPNQLEDVLGGGICQVSTTLFNAAFLAGLEIVERHNHSIFINHYPLGRDATVTGGGKNMRFRNDTAHYILIRGSSDGIKTKFVIYGTKDGRSVDYETSEFYDLQDMTQVTYVNRHLHPGTTAIMSEGQPGKSINVTRTVKAADGTVLHHDTFVSKWEMSPHKIEVPPPKTTTTRPLTTTTAAPTNTTATAGG
jgi:vancomycin resistance protein YoaR